MLIIFHNITDFIVFLSALVNWKDFFQNLTDPKRLNSGVKGIIVYIFVAGRVKCQMDLSSTWTNEQAMVPLLSWFSNVSHTATSGTLVTPSVMIIIPARQHKRWLTTQALYLQPFVHLL